MVASLASGLGGAEGYAGTIAAGATAAGWKVCFASPESEQLRPLLDRLRASGVIHIGVRPAARGATQQLLSSLSFVIALARAQPQVVLLVLPWPRFAFVQWLTCAVVRIPTVVVFQLVPEGAQELGREIAPRVRMYRWAHSRRQTWIAVSEYARTAVAELFGLPREGIGRIYNGVEVDERHGAATWDRDAQRSRLGIERDEFVVLSVGRLTAQKAHADLVAAVSEIASRYPGVRLLIAGDGPERQRLEEAIEAHALGDRVRLLGHVAEPARLLRVADAFVLPSRYEGTPFALLEAMASGLPVVAASFGGAREIIEHGRDGLVVPVGDTEALGAAIASLVDDPGSRTTMATAARTKVRRFSKAAMIDETLAVLARATSA